MLAWKWVLLCLCICPSFRTEVVNQALTVSRCRGGGKALSRSLSFAFPLPQQSLRHAWCFHSLVKCVSQSLFSPAPLLSGCVHLLQKPLCNLPCVYICLFPFRACSLSLKSLSDALNICGTQKPLHARSASVFWQASTSFELHFHCFIFI